MISARQAVVCDLDSTLFHTEHRHHLSPLTNPDATWEGYADACDGDGIIQGTARLLDMLHPHYQIHLCSGRSANARKKTREMLDKYAVSWDHLHLRPEGNRQSNGKFKVAYIKGLQGWGIDVVLMLEDWKEAADYILQETGVPYMLVNPGYKWIEERKAADGIGGGL